MNLIVPNSKFQPNINEGFLNHFMEAFKVNTPFDLLVYEKNVNS